VELPALLRLCLCRCGQDRAVLAVCGEASAGGLRPGNDRAGGRVRASDRPTPQQSAPLRAVSRGTVHLSLAWSAGPDGGLSRSQRLAPRPAAASSRGGHSPRAGGRRRELADSLSSWHAPLHSGPSLVAGRRCGRGDAGRLGARHPIGAPRQPGEGTGHTARLPRLREHVGLERPASLRPSHRSGLRGPSCQHDRAARDRADRPRRSDGHRRLPAPPARGHHRRNHPCVPGDIGSCGTAVLDLAGGAALRGPPPGGLRVPGTVQRLRRVVLRVRIPSRRELLIMAWSGPGGPLHRHRTRSRGEHTVASRKQPACRAHRPRL
jgi:hypothetical protein